MLQVDSYRVSGFSGVEWWKNEMVLRGIDFFFLIRVLVFCLPAFIPRQFCVVVFCFFLP